MTERTYTSDSEPNDGTLLVVDTWRDAGDIEHPEVVRTGVWRNGWMHYDEETLRRLSDVGVPSRRAGWGSVQRFRDFTPQQPATTPRRWRNGRGEERPPIGTRVRITQGDDHVGTVGEIARYGAVRSVRTPAGRYLRSWVEVEEVLPDAAPEQPTTREVSPENARVWTRHDPAPEFMVRGVVRGPMFAPDQGIRGIYVPRGEVVPLGYNRAGMMGPGFFYEAGVFGTDGFGQWFSEWLTDDWTLTQDGAGEALTQREPRVWTGEVPPSMTRAILTGPDYAPDEGVRGIYVGPDDRAPEGYNLTGRSGPGFFYEEGVRCLNRGSYSSLPPGLNYTLTEIVSDVKQQDVATPEQETAAPVEDFEAKYNALWAALGAESNRRNWCSEYDEFARVHGGPPRPPRRTSRTLLVTVSFPENTLTGEVRQRVTDAINRLDGIEVGSAAWR